MVQEETSLGTAEKTLMKQSEKMALTAILRVGSTIVVAVLAYLLSLAFFDAAIARNVTPNYAYGGAVLIFIAILAVWIGKLAVRIQVR